MLNYEEVQLTLAKQAQNRLKEKFPFTEVSTHYIAKYETKSGREVVLERERSDAIYLWLQKYDQVIDGVRINNIKFPGQPYEPKQTRNSNLNEKNAPKLKFGKRAFYLEIDNLLALESVVEWYSAL